MIRADGTADVAAIECRVAPYDWPFPRDEAERIDRHWHARRVETPALFDGRVLMSRDVSVVPGGMARLCGTSFEVAYKAFLSWRDFGFPGPPVVNLFAMPALRASDGAFMLGRMSRRTANAGRLYFPAGTPEPSDVGGNGLVNYDGNILRELEEETGLTAADVTLDATWTIVFAGPLVACMKIVRAGLAAADLRARVAGFIAAQAKPELDDLVAVASVADFDATTMPLFMTRYLTEALAHP